MAGGQEIKTRNGRVIKKPVETYKQDCVLTATKVKKCRDKKKTKEQNNARVKRFRDTTMFKKEEKKWGKFATQTKLSRKRRKI